MPLTPVQADIAALLAGNRAPDSYLAGGAALHLEPNSTRYSNDLGYFNDSEERVASAFEEDRATLEAAGHRVESLMNQPGYVRTLVTDPSGGHATKVEWAHESAWRFLPTPATHRCSCSSSCVVAGPFDRRTSRASRSAEPPDLPTLKVEWLEALDQAEAFVRARPTDEFGCLYYSRVESRFVGEGLDSPDVAPHYGRPGGVLPRFLHDSE